MCGTMPSVQPAVATKLARDPRESPAVIVNSAPVPGVATMINVVTKAPHSSLTLPYILSQADTKSTEIEPALLAEFR